MRSFRRFALLPAMTLIAATAASVVMPGASAFAASSTAPASLKPTEAAVAIAAKPRVPASPRKLPVLAIDATGLGYAVGTPPVPVSPSLTVQPSGITLTGATVRISSGLADTDSLGFTSQHGITGRYNAKTGVLTLTGKASQVSYQEALRSVTYRNVKSAVAVARRTISFQVTGGTPAGSLSNVVSRVITVSDQPPTAANDTATTDKNTAISIDVLAKDSDPAGRPLHIASVNTTGTKGKVSVNPDGTISYNPNGQFASLPKGQTATDSFTYRVSDGARTSNSESRSATVTVTITGGNDSPLISNVETAPLNYQAFSPATAVTGALTLSDDDDTVISGATVTISSGLHAGADTLSFTNQNGIQGSYNAGTGVLTLTGASSLADYQAALRSVDFAAKDPAASPATRTVSFTVTDSAGATSAPVSRNISVTPVAPPTAADDTASTGKNAPVDINVLANDSDPAGLPLTVAAVGTKGTLGQVSVNSDGTIHYDPAGQFASLQQGQTATDTFTYTATDGSQTSSPATVTITITGSDDLPVISGVGTTPVTYTAQSPAVPVSPGLSLSDDDDDTIVAAIAVIANGGDVSGDVLAFDSENGITGSYDASDQDLLMTGAASLADYQAALRSVTFATSDGSASPAARNVGFAVEDSLGQVSETEIQSVTVTAAAVPPDAVTQSYITPDLAVRLSVTRRTDRGYGTLTANTDSTFT